MMITHVGRTIGAAHRTPLEVVVHDTRTSEYIVCSATGPTADWFLNIAAQPPPRSVSKLLTSTGWSYDGTDADRVRMMHDIPMVAFSEPPSTR